MKNIIDQCPECRSIKIDSSRGEQTCRDCGLVVEETSFQNPFIGQRRKEFSTHPYLVKAGGRPTQGKVYKHQWLLSTRQKNLNKGLQDIERLAQRHNIPPFTVNEAKLMFKTALFENLAIGRDMQSLLFACVYASCLMHDNPKTPLELTAYTQVERSQMIRTYKALKKKLGLRLSNIDPVNLVPRFATRLSLSPETTSTTIRLVEQAKSTIIFSGKRPETLVASALYVASQQHNEPRTQRQIANTVGVIEVTIRKYSSYLSQEMTQLN